MKNKKTSWFMVPLVLAIWGVIGWKVYAVMRGKNDAPGLLAPTLKTHAENKDIPDTLVLLANYRDPFLDKIAPTKKISENQTASSRPVEKLPALPKPASWPVLAYHGLIRRNTDQKTLGFLNVGERSYFVQAGNEAGEVKVGKLWKDSVEIIWGKDRKVIRNN